jgi:hypothetical protein
MGLHNPYREYDKGMDDAYVGREPQGNSGQYMEGYRRSLQLEEQEQQREIEKQNDEQLKGNRRGGRR